MNVLDRTRRSPRRGRGLVAVAAALLLVTGLAGATSAQDDQLKVALVLPGSASDKGFNQSAFEALADIESQFGAQTAYTENTPVPEFEQAYRDYAGQGYDVIIGQGFEFGDIAKAVAPDFPDAKFIVTNNPDVAGPNMEGIQPQSHQSAYLAGVAAAMASQSGKIGGIAGLEFPVIVAQMEAFKAGAQSVNPQADVRLAYLGTFDDVAKGKETAAAMVSDGVDVIYHIADAAGVGVIQGAAEGGAKAIGWGKDQTDIAPDAVLTSQIVDQREMIVEAIGSIVDGTFAGAPVFYGLDTPVTGLAPIRAVDEAKAAEIEAKVAEIRDQIHRRHARGALHHRAPGLTGAGAGERGTQPGRARRPARRHPGRARRPRGRGARGGRRRPTTARLGAGGRPAAGPGPLLELRGIRKRYGPVVACDAADLEVRPARSTPSSVRTAPARPR